MHVTNGSQSSQIADAEFAEVCPTRSRIAAVCRRRIGRVFHVFVPFVSFVTS